MINRNEGDFAEKGIKLEIRIYGPSNMEVASVSAFGSGTVVSDVEAEFRDNTSSGHELVYEVNFPRLSADDDLTIRFEIPISPTTIRAWIQSDETTAYGDWPNT